MGAPIELADKTVGDGWYVYARRKATNTVDPSDWTDLRAHLRTHDGVLLASSDADEVTAGDDDTDPVLELSFAGNEDWGLPATDLKASPPVLSVHVVGDTAWIPSGNMVYLQVSATGTGQSLIGPQTVGTFSWLATPQIEVNEEAP